jgi:hypothetical protein
VAETTSQVVGQQISSRLTAASPVGAPRALVASIRPAVLGSGYFLT